MVTNFLEGEYADIPELFTQINIFMNEVKIPVFGLEISLWHLFLWGLVGFIAVFFIKKLFD